MVFRVICAIVLSLQSPADERYAVGVRLASAGDTAAAISAYREAVALNPRHVEAWNNLGDLLRRSGDREAALAALNHALALDRRHPRAALNAALTRIELRQFKEALPLIEIANTGLGNLPVFDYLYSKVYLELDDYKNAEPHLVRFRNVEAPSPAGALELATMLADRADFASAAEMLLAVPAEKRTDDILFRLAQAWHGLDQMEKAHDILVDLSGRKPADFKVALWRGLVERALGNNESAYSELQRALRLNPESADALVAMANLELERNEVPDAISLADRALELDGQDDGALLLRGLALLRIDRAADAVQTLTKVSKDTEMYAQSLYALSRAYRQLGESEKADAAIQEFRRVESGSAPHDSTPTRKRPR
jgi:tetratricopeptide (TPR) repeat protein